MINKFGKLAGWIITTLTLITLVFTFHDQILELFQNRHDKFSDQTHVEGDLQFPKLVKHRNENTISESISTYSTLGDTTIKKLPKINGIDVSDFRNKDVVEVIIGVNHSEIPVDSFYKGIDLQTLVRRVRFIPPIWKLSLTMGVINDRLYISTAFRDIQKEQIVGNIRYNHWILYKSNMFDYRDGNDFLEVQDLQGYVIFQIIYKANTIYISGYIITPVNVIILGNDSMNGHARVYAAFKTEHDWKKRAIEEISYIKSFVPPQIK